MRTPFGFECSYFFGDYYRGRSREDCRLLENSPTASKWSSDLCKTCPLPGIQRANACPNLILKGEVTGLPLGLMRRMKITAFCTRSNTPVSAPEVGCGLCHELPPEFLELKP